MIREGEVGNSFYIIEEGNCECLKSKQDGTHELVRKLTVGAHFGEIALLKNVMRTLSVKATSDSLKLLVLSNEAFERILGSIKDYLKEDYKNDAGEEFPDASFESDGKRSQPKVI